ncbi:hypothetical protein V1477_005865 [Vespula maculifrons]|uniref:Uncharacterized protein n=1 Tax=Vespula maculifrons TaxID=7453 RepID=A0ABD2CLG2_VESMC
MQNYIAKWEYSPTRDDNKIGTLIDFDSYWFSCVLYFDEYTSIKLRSGDTLPPVTTTKSDLRPTLTVTDSVLPSISTSTHRSSCSKRSPQWGYSPTLDDNISGPTVTDSVLLRISTSTRRSSPSMRSPQVIEKGFKLRVWILGLVRRQQSGTFDRLLQLLVHLCFEFRPVHIAVLPVPILRKIKLRSGDTLPPVTTTKSDLRPTLTVTDSVLPSISTSTHRSSRSKRSPQWGYSPTLDDNISGPTVTDSVLLRISTSTHRSSPSMRSPQVIEKGFKLRVGILGLVRRQQSGTFDRLLQLLVHLCFEFRRVNIAVLPVPILCKIKLRRGDTLPPVTTTKSDLRPTLTVTDSVLPSISTSTHRSSRRRLGLVRRQQSGTFNRLLQLLVHLCFEFRPVHIAVLPVPILRKIKLRSGDTLPLVTTTKSDLRPPLTVTDSVLPSISTSTHRSSCSKRSPQWGYSPTLDDNISGPTVTDSVLLRISTSTHRSSLSKHSPQVIEKRFKLEVGILGLVRRQQSWSFD